VFDLLELEGRGDLRHQCFEMRYLLLRDLLDAKGDAVPSMRLLKASMGEMAKRAELRRLKQGNLEGAVFKDLNAPFEPGYSDATLKFKFNESSAAVVMRHNQQRSVQIGFFDDKGALVPAGNVTIPPNHQVPPVDSVVEIQYLYYNGPGGSLEQPVFLNVRHDMDREEALLAQITRYKPEDEEPPKRERQTA
jgi:bifunctional non-homologous end joining protein LigD